ncbi:NYN domain-containing protein [Aeoliella sp. ICT_H6.2]|uniref:NYN domain-containing protein n=1 Tax=Aeoliella straminimaris TaxID=2954799 RepID=A0A9X2JJ75_9BACT|nr:NYN domain-containing protein [Aeoliella straminimaris]MCO6044699.1 NYN domain-containing protein [Aeoliella straminimaris]
MLLTEDVPQLSLEVFSDVFTKVFYYDASPVSDTHPQAADANAGQIFDELMREFNRTRGCHVFVGRTMGKKKRQKQVDVKLAVDMLSHTLHGNMRSATLIAGDQDFLPVLEALKLAGMYLRLVYISDSFSDALVDAADESHCMSWREVLFFTDGSFRGSHKWPSMSNGDLAKFSNNNTHTRILAPTDLPGKDFQKKVAEAQGYYYLEVPGIGGGAELRRHTNLQVLCSCAAAEFPKIFRYEPA